MKVLLTGGSGAGKSTYAQNLGYSLSENPVFIETDVFKKVTPKQNTIYHYKNMETANIKPEDTVILDCVCNLTANEMFDGEDINENAAAAVLDGIITLSNRCQNLIVVTNEVGGDGIDYDVATELYIKNMGEVNRGLANAFDHVYEFSASLPMVLKGDIVLSKEKRGDEMILIVGGTASGKLEYVKTAMGYADDDIADGALDSRPVLYNLQKIVKENPSAVQDLLPKLLKKEVVICDEVGSGIIPIDEDEVAYRVATGRLCNILGENAKEVIRMVCGIPVKLK